MLSKDLPKERPSRLRANRNAQCLVSTPPLVSFICFLWRHPGSSSMPVHTRVCRASVLTLHTGMRAVPMTACKLHHSAFILITPSSHLAVEAWLPVSGQQALTPQACVLSCPCPITPPQQTLPPNPTHHPLSVSCSLNWSASAPPSHSASSSLSSKRL